MASALIFFAEKYEQLLHFCRKNINVFENTLATTVNEFVINELVNLTMLWATGPRLRGCISLEGRFLLSQQA